MECLWAIELTTFGDMLNVRGVLANRESPGVFTPRFLVGVIKYMGVPSAEGGRTRIGRLGRCMDGLGVQHRLGGVSQLEEESLPGMHNVKV